MQEPLASPRARRLAAPGWLDGRLVVGVLLVLVSVVVGARLLSRADATQAVWMAARDLAPGTALTEDDLEVGRVQLLDNGDRYLLATGPRPVGYVLQRGVGADELLPRDSLSRPDALGGPRRDVSVPVGAGHLPEDLRAGQQVDVYVTGKAAEQTGAASRRVLSGVSVALRPEAGGLGASGSASVVLSVAQADVVAVVSAAQLGSIDLVRVPRSQELPPLSGPLGLAAGG